MEREINKIQTDLWNLSNNYKSPKRDYLVNISISLFAIELAVNEFLKNNDPQISVCYAKILIMELWSIREFLKALQITLTEFDEIFPELKKLRDSYAHIKERIKGEVMENNNKPTKLAWESKSIANGAKLSSNGRNWQPTKPIIREFNITFNGNQGVMSIFGIVNNFLICNSSNSLIEFEISKSIPKNLFRIINVEILNKKPLI